VSGHDDWSRDDSSTDAFVATAPVLTFGDRATLWLRGRCSRVSSETELPAFLMNCRFGSMRCGFFSWAEAGKGEKARDFAAAGRPASR
jgi:hypothetical protein